MISSGCKQFETLIPQLPSRRKPDGCILFQEICWISSLARKSMACLLLSQESKQQHSRQSSSPDEPSIKVRHCSAQIQILMIVFAQSCWLYQGKWICLKIACPTIWRLMIITPNQMVILGTLTPYGTVTSAGIFVTTSQRVSHPTGLSSVWDDSHALFLLKLGWPCCEADFVFQW